MDISDPQIDAPFLKPGRMLGLVVFAAIFAGFMLWMAQDSTWASEALQVKPENRVTFFAGWTAFVATLWAAHVGVRNMVRQHTVNTLLQSRLSDVFMERGESLNAAMERYVKLDPQTRGAPHLHVDIAALRYMLNYYEYVAIGIKHGDLDKSVMDDMMRGTIIRMCDTFEEHILEARARNPRIYRNLVALAIEWKHQSNLELDQQRFHYAMIASRNEHWKR
ncbi:DUF4760 domain-containing protein [Comamonas thiooxydans]|uniref:DUF4760 domain-containing protein n=1 Tax=Comamonas thiooxydans TaxID=363952 RepID=UPI000579CEA9|nr:DUF4760 domain-containing protein [Comamonas thiooxydans]